MQESTRVDLRMKLVDNFMPILINPREDSFCRTDGTNFDCRVSMEKEFVAYREQDCTYM